MALGQSALLEVLEALKAAEVDDRIRQVAETICQALIEAEALTEFGPKPEGKDWDSFAQRVFFAGGGFSPGSPGSLLDVLGEARTSIGDSPQMVYYMAVPPVAFGGLTQALGQYGLAHGVRVVYEKPFGTSPDSFRELDRVVHSVLDEQQVYRIDHFLGKEATQDRCPVLIRTRAGTRSWLPGCGSIIPAGGTCRSTCAPGSGWPRRSSGSA
jgi:glucose-6-phosphate 1-dehydrogenase